MKLRKAVSLILALVLALSLSAPTFAYSEASGELVWKSGQEQHSMTFTGEDNTPIVQMIVPATAAQLIFNPYGLEYDGSEITGNAADTALKDQIITKEQYIKNLSAGNVQVDIKAQATVGDGTNAPTPSTSSITADSTKAAAKSIFLYLEMYRPQVGDDGVELTNASDFDGWKNGNYTTKSLPKNYSVLVLTAKSNKEVTKEKIAILNAAVPEDADATGGDLADLDYSELKPVTGGVLAFKVSGNATGTLTEGDWGTGDAPKVTLTFTFKFTSVASDYAA